MANTVRSGTFDELPAARDARAFIVNTGPSAVKGLYLSDGTAWTLQAASGLPDTEGASEGDTIVLDEELEPGWGTPSGGSQPWRSVGTYRWFDTIYVSITAESGTFTLTVNGETTAAIAFDASLEDMLAAIILLPGVTPDDVGIDDLGGIGFALGFLDDPVTGNDGGLTGETVELIITGSDRCVEVFTLADGDILDNAICQRITPFTAGASARLTDSPSDEVANTVWSAPFRGASALGKSWDVASGDEFTSMTGRGDFSSPGRVGARQVSYSSDDVTEWYVTLPARAKVDTPIYLHVFADDWSLVDAGEIEILVSTYTPA